jgi:hypothetical protein
MAARLRVSEAKGQNEAMKMDSPNVGAAAGAGARSDLAAGRERQLRSFDRSAAGARCQRSGLLRTRSWQNHLLSRKAVGCWLKIRPRHGATNPESKPRRTRGRPAGSCFETAGLTGFA